jgi:hypothetical protein
MSGEGKVMISKFQRVLDPLDLEILERAFDDAWAAVKEGDARVKSDCDEALEVMLRQELVDIARIFGISEPDTLRDILLARSWGCRSTPPMSASD